MLLMYHHIAPRLSILNQETVFCEKKWNWYHTPEAFERHIQYFLRRGFRFVSMNEYIHTLDNRRKGITNELVITLDDGWLDNYEYAYPILQKYHICAIFLLLPINLYHRIRLKWI